MSFIAVGIGLAVAGTAGGMISAGKAKREAERKEKIAVKEMDRLKDVYSSLDTSNPYANMENTMEDLTINQKQYELEAQQFQQSQSNVLSGLRESAGSSGVAGVAQALAGQGQLAAQQSSSSIGTQERQNQQAERSMAANLQSKEREGEVWSRNAEKDKQSTLLGMSQQEVGAYREEAAAAQQAKMDALASGVSSVGSMLTGPGSGMGGAGGGMGGGMAAPQGGPSSRGDIPPPCPGLL